MMGGTAISAKTENQEATAHHSSFAVATQSVAHVMQRARLVLELAGVHARAVLVAGGCTKDTLAATAKTATAMQIAYCQTPTAACQTTCAILVIHPAPHAMVTARAAVPAAIQAMCFKVSVGQPLCSICSTKLPELM